MERGHGRTLRRRSKRGRAAALLAWMALTAGSGPGAASDWRPEDVFNEVWTLCTNHFYDAGRTPGEWGALKVRYEEAAGEAADAQELASVVNLMLGELKTSHTRFYTRADPEYYQILDIFRTGAMGDQIRGLFPAGNVEYTGIGIFTERTNGSVFVRGVLDGGPAAEAGLQVGDRILGVDGAPYHPLHSFEGREGKPVTVTVQPSADVRSVQELSVVPVRIVPGEFFVRAMERSTRIIRQEPLRIGYIHIWSYGGQEFHDLLLNQIAFGKLKNADALVLDLRDGWGGAEPRYLNVFNTRVPALTRIGRFGDRSLLDFQWRKPVVMLVNEGTRSGKEVLAYGFQKHGIGTLVGTRTAGAVMFGRPFLLGDGSLLYLAVADVLVDGERLEGRGVIPDVEVPFALEYAQGRDPQLEEAIRLLSEAEEMRPGL